MHAALQRRIQRYGWDRASSLYEESWREQLAPAQHRLLKAARLCAAERVIEVTCGTGLVSLPVAAAVHPFGHRAWHRYFRKDDRNRALASAQVRSEKHFVREDGC